MGVCMRLIASGSRAVRLPRGFVLGTCLALATALPVPGALAATEVGQLDPAADPVGSCMGTTVFAQRAAVGESSYAVPSGGGVITGWSHKANSVSGRELALKLLRSQGDERFAVVGGSALEVLEPSTVNTFSTRVPVQGGDLIGLWIGNPSGGGPLDPGGGASCAFYAPLGNTVQVGFFGPEPAAGAADEIGNDYLGMRLNVTATVEPDADGDGYGDESQDGCPADASIQGGCPADPPPPPASAGGPAPTWLTFGGRARDSVGDLRIALRVTADRPVQLFVRGRIAIGNRPRAFALRPVRRILRTEVPRTVPLKLSPKMRRSVRRALKRGVKATAKLSIVAIDNANERVSATRSIRLTR
jgi:hypothetical protein